MNCLFHCVYSGVVYREDTEQVLVIQDKYKVHLYTHTVCTCFMHCNIYYRVLPLQFVHWKFPGGLAKPTEDISKPPLPPWITPRSPMTMGLLPPPPLLR